MNNLFSTRLSNHHRHLQKYLRFILNDSFVVILTFLFGGATLYYSQLLKQLPTPFYPGRFISLGVCIILLLIGNFATLLKPADRLFLLPKELEMNQFLDKARNYSMILPTVVLAFGLGFLMPLIRVSTGWQLSVYPLILIGMIGLKFADMQAKRQAIYQITDKKRKIARLVWWIGSLLSLIGLFFIHLIVFYVWMILVNLHFIGQKRHLKNHLLDWHYAIENEQKRLHRIYQFINLFTDVPFIKTKMRKMHGAKWIFNLVSKTHDKTYSYLFIRRLMRGDEYFGQIVRLLLLGAICLLAVDDWRFILVISGLFLYLITFQLIPLVHQYQTQVLTRLYPVNREIQIKNFYQVFQTVVAICVILFTLISLFQIQLANYGYVVGGNILIGLLLRYTYVPNRLKKLQFR